MGKSWLCHFRHTGVLAKVVSVGLVMYCISVALGFVLLLYDARLELSGQKTITAWTCESWWRIAGLLFLIFLGWAGVALHFITYRLLYR